MNEWMIFLSPTPELTKDSFTLSQRFYYGECHLWMGRSSSQGVGVHPLTCMPSCPEIPIPMSATCIMLTSLAPSPAWDRRKGEKHIRSKEKMQTLQISSGHSSKQILQSLAHTPSYLEASLAEIKCPILLTIFQV